MKDLVFYDKDGGTRFGAITLETILAGATATPRKVCCRSSGDEDWGAALRVWITKKGSSDGNGQLLLGADSATLSPPWNVTGEVSAGGGSWSGTGTFAAVVTAVNATGETIASVEATATVANLTDTVTWRWAAVPGAATYNVFRRAYPAGTYATPSKIGNTASLSFADTGAAPGAGAPPTENTTGGAGPAYGTPPTMGFGPVTLGPLVSGRWAFYWLSCDPPSSLSPGQRWADLYHDETPPPS